MEWIIFIILIVGVVLFILKSKIPDTKDYPYEKHSALLTAAERSFYGVLCKTTAGKAVVFGKVRVADVLKTKKGLNASKRQTAFNQISAKHFDFVLCNPDDLSVIATVELDDSSHNSKKRIARDEFLESACEAANLKLHRFKASNSYNISEVRETLFPAPVIQTDPPSSEQRIEPKLSVGGPESQVDKQVCPKCSAELVRKTACKGKHKGSKFLACSRFPDCRYILKQEVM